jgi:citrate lyase subunit alpha/citrate CoA-transferase
MILGGSGGHSDTAAGAKLSLVVTKLARKHYPSVVKSVTTVTTPGESIDALVTEAGIAVNPRRGDLAEKLAAAGLPVVAIEDLLMLAGRIVGAPPKPCLDERIVAVVEYRDGTVIDVVRAVRPAPAE